MLSKFCTLLAACFLFVSDGKAEEITLTTLEWPPYTGDSLPKFGATTEVVRQALELVGVKLKVVSLPWKRAISTADKDPTVAAYFPGYHCDHRDAFVKSASIGSGPLGLAEHVEADVSWSSLSDLSEQQIRIGTVSGYQNTADFDHMVDAGELRVVQARDDLTNLRKLSRKRLDAVVIDKLVMSYMLVTEPALKDFENSIRFDETPLENKELYVCFKEGEGVDELVARFNEALAGLDSDKIVSEYFAEEF